MKARLLYKLICDIVLIGLFIIQDNIKIAIKNLRLYGRWYYGRFKEYEQKRKD
jgi:hypothetical protein